MIHEKEPTISVSCRLRADKMQFLDELADNTKRSRSFLIAEAVDQYLDKQSWQIKQIEEGVEMANRPDAKFAKHEDVMRWLESWETDNPTDPPICR